MLTLTVFLSGAVLMSLEMVGSRILAPTFGSSIYIWGSLIVVVMAALTLGYYLGGRLADRYPYFLVIGLILAGAGAFIGFLPFWTGPVNALCGRLEPRAGSLLVACAFFFLPSILLATVSPYAVKLAGRDLKNLGNIAGRLSAIASTGSVIGTLVTSFFLIPLTGVRNIVHALGLLLLFLALLIIGCRAEQNQGLAPGLFWVRRLGGVVVLVLLALLAFCWRLTARRDALSRSEVLYERDTLYNHVQVTQYGSVRYLRFDNSLQSAVDLDDPLHMVFPIPLSSIWAWWPIPSRNGCFYRLGGGSAPMKFLHDYSSLQTVDVVEIDPEVVRWRGPILRCRRTPGCGWLPKTAGYLSSRPWKKLSAASSHPMI